LRSCFISGEGHEAHPTYRPCSELLVASRVTVAEVEDAIRTGKWRSASHGRQETSKEFAYGRDWNGTVYATKRVRPIFVDAPTEIVVITVYTYFF
jgi:hypothetical protein